MNHNLTKSAISVGFSTSSSFLFYHHFPHFTASFEKKKLKNISYFSICNFFYFISKSSFLLVNVLCWIIVVLFFIAFFIRSSYFVSISFVLIFYLLGFILSSLFFSPCFFFHCYYYYNSCIYYPIYYFCFYVLFLYLEIICALFFA